MAQAERHPAAVTGLDCIKLAAGGPAVLPWWLLTLAGSGNAAPGRNYVDELCQYWHNSSMKEVRWHGSSRSDVEAFPADARREVGYQLFQVQIGEEPSDWKPMTSIGPGVREIRIRQATGAYRVIFLATIGDAVHVLHAFQKKTQATAKRDIDLARIRLKQIR
jgi:phage-related protein